jgi:hypothetical protein
MMINDLPLEDPKWRGTGSDSLCGVTAWAAWVRRFGSCVLVLGDSKIRHEISMLQSWYNKKILRADPSNHHPNEMSFDQKMVNTLILVCVVWEQNIVNPCTILYSPLMSRIKCESISDLCYDHYYYIWFDSISRSCGKPSICSRG